MIMYLLREEGDAESIKFISQNFVKGGKGGRNVTASAFKSSIKIKLSDNRDTHAVLELSPSQPIKNTSRVCITLLGCLVVSFLFFMRMKIMS